MPQHNDIHPIIHAIITGNMDLFAAIVERYHTSGIEDDDHNFETMLIQLACLTNKYEHIDAYREVTDIDADGNCWRCIGSIPHEGLSRYVALTRYGTSRYDVISTTWEMDGYMEKKMMPLKVYRDEDEYENEDYYDDLIAWTMTPRAIPSWVITDAFDAVRYYDLLDRLTLIDRLDARRIDYSGVCIDDDHTLRAIIDYKRGRGTLLDSRSIPSNLQDIIPDDVPINSPTHSLIDGNWRRPRVRDPQLTNLSILTEILDLYYSSSVNRQTDSRDLSAVYAHGFSLTYEMDWDELVDKCHMTYGEIVSMCVYTHAPSSRVPTRMNICQLILDVDGDARYEYLRPFVDDLVIHDDGNVTIHDMVISSPSDVTYNLRILQACMAVGDDEKCRKMVDVCTFEDTEMVCEYVLISRVTMMYIADRIRLTETDIPADDRRNRKYWLVRYILHHRGDGECLNELYDDVIDILCVNQVHGNWHLVAMTLRNYRRGIGMMDDDDYVYGQDVSFLDPYVHVSLVHPDAYYYNDDVDRMFRRLRRFGKCMMKCRALADCVVIVDE